MKLYYILITIFLISSCNTLTISEVREECRNDNLTFHLNWFNPTIDDDFRMYIEEDSLYCDAVLGSAEHTLSLIEFNFGNDDFDSPSVITKVNTFHANLHLDEFTYYQNWEPYLDRVELIYVDPISNEDTVLGINKEFSLDKPAFVEFEMIDSANIADHLINGEGWFAYRIYFHTMPEKNLRIWNGQTSIKLTFC